MEISTNFKSSSIGLGRSIPSGPNQGELTIYDINSRQVKNVFPVFFDGGKNRMSLGRDSLSSFVGCYGIHGLGCYSNKNGVEVWRRKDLKKVQHVKAFHHSDHVFCGRDGAGHLIDADSGETIEKTRGVKSVYPSPFDELFLVGANDLELHAPFGTRVGKISRTTFAELDACFSDGEVLVSESTGPIRCFDVSSMELLWGYLPPDGYHFLNVCYNLERKCFIGRMWRYLDGRDPVTRLIHFDCHSGSILKEIEMPSEIPTTVTFCLSGSTMVASDFRLWDMECNKIEKT